MSNTAAQAFAETVVRHASHTALIGEDGQALSYADLDRLRRDAARALLAHGIAHGDRVAIWAPNGLEWIVAGLAILSIGAVLVPVNTRLRAAETAYQLEKSGSRLLFCAGRFRDQHFPSLLGAQRPACVETVVVLSQPQAGDITWSDFLEHAAAVDTREVDRRAAAVREEDRMDILFTSGTTGLPKGVVSGHRQNLRTIAAWSAAVGLSANDRYLIVNPFFHSFGYKVGWLGGLLAGCTLLPHAVFDARVVLTRIAAQRISVLPGPPTLFIGLLDLLAQGDARARYDLSSLRAAVTGAATIAPSLIERIGAELGFKLVLSGYGLTETCGVVSMCVQGDDAQTIATTCGRAIPGTELRCMDPQGRLLPADEVGEIVTRGYHVMQGYLDDDDATREAIDADGWLHTGDVGALDAHGYLRITDRLKDLYIAGGFNCYPAEIERIIAAHPAVAQIAVIGVPDPRLGEVGKACVVLRPQARLEPAELISWCRDQMANYKVPRSVEIMAALPVNAAGKVLKTQLREAASRS